MSNRHAKMQKNRHVLKRFRLTRYIGEVCPKIKNQENDYTEYNVMCNLDTPDVMSNEDRKSIFRLGFRAIIDI